MPIRKSVFSTEVPVRFASFLCLLLFSAVYSLQAQAQHNGVGVGKACPTATMVGELATCTLLVINEDDFGDTLEVIEFWDVVDPSGSDGGPIRVPAVGNLPIVEVSDATCTAAPVDPVLAPLGLVFPCVLDGVVGTTAGGFVRVMSQYTVPAGATDPLIDQGNVIVVDGCNLQPVDCNPNPEQQQFGAAVSLFVPSLEASKSGPSFAYAGEVITYTIGFTDTTTGTGFPGFENCTGDDTLLGDLGAFTAGVTRDFQYTVLPDDPDPLPNTVTITCGVVGFDAIEADSATHTVDLIPALCGDALPHPTEQCDDGNTANGDGCSASCQIEAGFTCTEAIAGLPPTPSACSSTNGPPSPPPVITSPPDGASVTIEGDASDPFVVTWSASIDPDDDPVNYLWQLFDGATWEFAADLRDQTTTQGLLTMGGMRQFLNEEFGMTRGDSRTFNHRALATDYISETAEGPFASVTLTVGNFSPTADDDSYDATEDTLLTIAAPGVLDGDTDPEDDPLTAVLDTDVSNGTLDLSDDGSFTFDPDDNYCGDDSFTYKANDGNLDSNVATVSITVACVNDLPEVTSASPVAQTVDYSDDIARVTIVVTDIDDASTTLAESGEPAESVSSLSLTAATPNCVTDNTLSPNPAEVGSVCTWTYDGQVLSPGDNVHDIVFTPSDGDGAGTVTGTHELTIQPEDADVMLDGDNDVSAEVDSPGGDSGPFSLFFAAYETDNPDFSHGSSADFGDLNTMEPFITLVPVGPGSPVDADSCVFIAPLPVYPAEGYDQEAFFQCDFDNVPVNTYEVEARVDGLSDETIYYSGSDEDVFTVFDPSLGFTTGGGWFYWPDTADEELTECGPDGYLGDKTNFGFSLKYNKKKKTAKGSVLVMRHTVDENCLDAGSYRVKSNAIEGMSLGDGEDGAGAYGWATAAGKSVFREPGLEGEGNHPFLMYVEDHGQQGCNQDPVDEFWIEVKDKDEVIVLQLNGPKPAGADEDEPIVCGNIVVPHKSGKGGGGEGGPKEPNPNKPPKG